MSLTLAGSEIYVGCANGQLLRFVLQANAPDTPESYTLLSSQSLPAQKPITELVLIQCISRLLVLCESQIHIFTLPSLDPIPISPIRNVVSFAVDHQQLLKPMSTEPLSKLPPVDLCVIKRNSIGLFALREKLSLRKDIPFPNGGSLARRTGPYLCVPGDGVYNVINLDASSALPVMPVSQIADPNAAPVKPLILVISEMEFLIVSSMDGRGLGVFITGNGDPMRGTLEWSAYPESICFDFPYVAALLPNKTIEIHNIETQAIAQIVPAPTSFEGGERLSLSTNLHGYMVPSTQRSDKLRTVSVPLLRTTA